MNVIPTLVAALSFLSFVAAQDDGSQSTTGKRVGGPLGYIPSIAPAVIFCELYAAVAIYGTWLLWKRPGKYMTTLIVSGYIYAFGLILRVPYRNHHDGLMLYIFMNMCIVLSPCGLIATVYILLGRLARQLHAEDLMLISPRIITKVYVTSDVVTLFVQASGGSLAAFKNGTLTNISTKIFLFGLILQLISFLSYCVVFVNFLYRLKTWRGPVWNEPMTRGVRSHWKGLIGAMVVSSLCIVIRCFYRTVEGSQGFDGYLLTHESYFFALDTLPLWIAVVVYVIVWPPVILTDLYGSVGQHELGAKDSRTSV